MSFFSTPHISVTRHNFFSEIFDSPRSHRLIVDLLTPTSFASCAWDIPQLTLAALSVIFTFFFTRLYAFLITIPNGINSHFFRKSNSVSVSFFNMRFFPVLEKIFFEQKKMGPHTEAPLSWQNTKHKVASVHHRQQTTHKHIPLFRLDEQSRFLRPFVHGKNPSPLNQRRGYQKVH